MYFLGAICSAFKPPAVDLGDILQITEDSGVAYMLYNPLSDERCKRPYIYDVIITGTYAVGNTLQVTVIGEVNGPFNASTPIYQWYKLSSLQGGVPSLIIGATGSSYVLVSSDEGFYIYCEARFVQVEGINKFSEWWPSDPTPIIAPGSGGGLEDIDHPWVVNINIEAGGISSTFNTDVNPVVPNPGTGDDWTTVDATKPFYNSTNGTLEFRNAHRVAGTTMSFPPLVEIWVKGQFTANNGAMLGWGSQVLFGMNSSNQWYIKDIIVGAGDLNEHVFRIVLNGVNSIFQVDNGTEFIFDENFTSATSLAAGQTFSGAFLADCDIKKIQITAGSDFLDNTKRDAKWAYELA